MIKMLGMLAALVVSNVPVVAGERNPASQFLSDFVSSNQLKLNRQAASRDTLELKGLLNRSSAKDVVVEIRASSEIYLRVFSESGIVKEEILQRFDESLSLFELFPRSMPVALAANHQLQQVYGLLSVIKSHSTIDEQSKAKLEKDTATLGSLIGKMHIHCLVLATILEEQSFSNGNF